MRVRIVEGDLLRQDVDVIVNAANTHLMHGAGIAGAIARAGGPQIQAESNKLRPVPTGGAVYTNAGKLPFDAVIHAVGPIWRNGLMYERELLARTHHSVIEVAHLIGARKIALPAISCGIFGFPVQIAAPIAIRAVREAAEHYGASVDECRFVLLDPGMAAQFIKALPTCAS